MSPRSPYPPVQKGVIPYHAHHHSRLSLTHSLYLMFLSLSPSFLSYSRVESRQGRFLDDSFEGIHLYDWMILHCTSTNLNVFFFLFSFSLHYLYYMYTISCPSMFLSYLMFSCHLLHVRCYLSPSLLIFPCPSPQFFFSPHTLCPDFPACFIFFFLHPSYQIIYVSPLACIPLSIPFPHYPLPITLRSYHLHPFLHPSCTLLYPSLTYHSIPILFSSLLPPPPHTPLTPFLTVLPFAQSSFILLFYLPFLYLSLLHLLLHLLFPSSFCHSFFLLSIIYY